MKSYLALVLTAIFNPSWLRHKIQCTHVVKSPKPAGRCPACGTEFGQ